MPIMEVILQTSYFGQECINRWNYLSSGTPAAVSHSFALASAMGWITGGGTDFPADTVAESIQELVSQSVDFIQVEVKNVYSVVDFYNTPFPSGTDGDVSATNGISPTSAYGLFSSRSRSDIRRGMKRFVGVTEGSISSGGVVVAPGLTTLGELASRMSDDLEYDDEGNTLTYSPIIVSKEKYTTPSGRSAYRYYGTEAEQLMHIMDSIIWQPYPETRTQVSRQYGRGR